VEFVVTGRFSADQFVQAANPPAWFQYSDHLSPFVAIETIRDGLFEVTGYGTQHTDLIVPIFLYSVAVSALFAGGTLVIVKRRFDRSDLE
jgi:hypothetical protein